jgi:orotidine-5'-phosphate decarboxylase
MRSRPQPIVALDVATLGAARDIVACLGDRADFYKVGLQLFTVAGAPAVEWLRSEGKRVFLDLKLHDIPITVQRAAAAARSMGVSLVTVHGIGGEAMVRAAVEGAHGDTDVLVVTVLTSMDVATASAALGRPFTDLEGEVLRLSALARSSGARGVVCGGTECAAVRAMGGASLDVLVPGIRLSGETPGDQRRITTPAEAASAGATYVVLGRTVTQAADPVDAYTRVLAELA